MSHAAADGLDDARALVPGDDRQRVLGRSADEVVIAVADAAGGELDAHLARARVGEVERLDDEGGVRLVEYGGLNTHR